MRVGLFGSALLVVALVPVFAISTFGENMKPAEVKKITPILFAEELEPCIEFWTERMGFQKTIEVPEGNKIGFVLLAKNELELMYQSFASAEIDNAATGVAVRKGPSFLYIEVADIDAALAATKGAEIVMPMRTTFYQAKEFGTKDPVGHYLIFAQQGAAQEK
ncbi:MAG TPA: VOC family protein [Candidatus Binatia bacterium]|nr:VOC family protein [Candidatus Binatia bacterium]